jgi:hypothetical protein
VEAQRVGIQNLNADNWLDREVETGRAVQHSRDAAEGKHHIIGGERRAIGEGNALPQLELPRCRVDHLPGYRKSGLRPEVGIGPQQRVEHVTGQVIVGTQVVIVRVHGGEGAADRDVQRTLRLGWPD